MIIAAIIIGVAALSLCLTAVVRHQNLLKGRAQLMRDAMRHRDFSFRLPTRGLLFGERALQNAVNDMGHEIEKLVAHNEVESWQRLTRVLTHEIMNVITPIRSISQAYLADPDIEGTSYEEGIRAIRDASDGLATFVENYRKMALLQEPVLKEVGIAAFFSSLMSLYPDLKWNIDVPSDVYLYADESLLRQVFINLVKNAVEADAGTIGISYVVPPVMRPQLAARRFRNSALRGGGVNATGKLLVSNDGHCIPDDVAREIFIPFFTTKKKGSGIGLSLSRQILLRQGIILSLASSPAAGYNVTFILEADRP